MTLKTPRHSDRKRRLASAAASVLLVAAAFLASSTRCLADASLNPGQGPILRTQAKLPMSFEANQGQTDSQVKFLSRGRGYTLFLTSTQAVLSLQRPAQAEPGPSAGRASKAHRAKARPSTGSPAVFKMIPVGGNLQPEVEPLEPLAGLANYFIGQEPKDWRVGVPTYGKVLYREVYPGIDLAYYGSQGQLEYDFVIRPGAAPEAIRLRFEGADGLELDAAGGLTLSLDGKSVRWPKPVIYQLVHGVRSEVQGNYVLTQNREVSFQAEAYDTNWPLIIDPVLVYSTYLGGNGQDAAEAMFVERGGNVYLTGETLSANFPPVSAYDAAFNGSNDVFVAKLNPNGTALLYSTYIGGSGNDLGQSIAVDAGGNAYVTGHTDSPNFPLKNAYQSSPGGGGFSDAFLVKLGPAGSTLLYSTYFGGGNFDSGNSIAVDSSGKAYLAGETSSDAGFPTTSKPFQSRAGGGLDAFVAKFDPSLTGVSSLIYSSWLGGVEDDRAVSIAVDSSGNAYVTGETFSFDLSTSTFPALNALQPGYGGGPRDGFVAKINPAGSSVLFATFIGGSDDDSAFALTLDSSSNIYITGETSSFDFPLTADAQQPELGDAGYFGTMDAFITKIPSSGANVLYSTFLGGTIDEGGRAIAVGGSGQIYVTGYTSSYDFPVTVGADQTFYGGGADDVFVVELNPAAPGPSGLIYSTYLGGNGFEMGNCIGLNTNGNFYVCGVTYSTNGITTAGVYQPNYAGGFSDGFLAKFASPSDLSVSIVASPSPVIVNNNLTYTLQINNNGRTTFTGVMLTNVLPSGVQFLSFTNNRGSCANSSGKITCAFGTLTNNASATVTVVVKPPTPTTITNRAILTANEAEINTGNNQPILLTDVQGIADLSIRQVDAPDPVFVGSNVTYSITVTNAGPWPARQVVLNDYLSATVTYVTNHQSQGTFTYDTASGSVVFFLGDLPANSSATAQLVVAPFTTDPTSNVVDVASLDFDPVLSNNTNSILTTVNGSADLAVSASASPSPGIVGSNLVYTVTVSNLGSLAANSVVFTNRLPAGPAFVSAVSTQGSCSRSGNLVTCNLGSIANGAPAKVTITLMPATEGTLTNVSNAASSSPDPVPGNNAITAVTQVVLPFDAAVSASDAPDPVSAGSNLVYSVIVTNRGAFTLSGVLLTNTLPAAVNFASAIPSQGSFTRSGNVISCSLGSISPQASASVAITAVPTTPGSLTNVAVVAFAGTDGNPSNNSVTNVTRVNSPPTISAISPQSVNEDATAGPISFTVGDVETPAGSLTVSGSSSNPALVSSAGFVFGGSGASRTVTIAPLANQFGTATITITVADSDGGTGSTSFLLTVNAVNDPPTIDVLPDLTLSEDSGLRTVSLTGISGGPANEPQAVTVIATNSNKSLLTNVTVSYASPSATGTLSFGTVSNANGAATITVVVTDTGLSNNLTARVFNVSVTPVNDPPTLNSLTNLVLNVNAGQQLIGLSGITAGPPDEAGQTLSVSATSSRPILLPNPTVNYSNPNSTGTLILNPAPDTIGNATVTVTVQDSGGTANGGANSISRSFLLTVALPPALQILRTNNLVVLSWSTNVPGFVLETRPGLANTNAWVPVTKTPATVGNQFMVTNTIGAGPAFFRLRNQFSLVLPPPPLLAIKRTGNLALVSWPTNATGFGLETRSSLSTTGAWSAVTNTPAVAGDRYVVSASLAAGPAFFRLRSQ